MRSSASLLLLFVIGCGKPDLLGLYGNSVMNVSKSLNTDSQSKSFVFLEASGAQAGTFEVTFQVTTGQDIVAVNAALNPDEFPGATGLGGGNRWTVDTSKVESQMATFEITPQYVPSGTSTTFTLFVRAKRIGGSGDNPKDLSITGTITP